MDLMLQTFLCKSGFAQMTCPFLVRRIASSNKLFCEKLTLDWTHFCMPLGSWSGPPPPQAILDFKLLHYQPADLVRRWTDPCPTIHFHNAKGHNSGTL